MNKEFLHKHIHPKQYRLGGLNVKKGIAIVAILILLICLQTITIVTITKAYKNMCSAYEAVYQRLEVNAIRQNEILTLVRELQGK